MRAVVVPAHAEVAEHGIARAPERAPAHVPGRVGPVHPRRGPHAGRLPVPAEAEREPPVPIVVRGPPPRVARDPERVPGGVAAPVAHGVRPPVHGHRGIPDRPFHRVRSPRAVLIERARVDRQLRRQVLGRGRAQQFVAARRTPAIEFIPPGRVEVLRRAGSEAVADHGALAGPQVLGAVAARNRRQAPVDRELHFAAPRTLGRPHAELARATGLNRGDRRVDLVADRALRIPGAPRNHVHAAVQQPQQIGCEQVHRRVAIQVQQRPVGQDDLGSAIHGPHAVAVEQRQIRGGRVRAAFTIDEDAAFEEREVGGGRP